MSLLQSSIDLTSVTQGVAQRNPGYVINVSNELCKSGMSLGFLSDSKD